MFNDIAGNDQIKRLKCDPFAQTLVDKSANETGLRVIATRYFGPGFRRVDADNVVAKPGEFPGDVSVAAAEITNTFDLLQGGYLPNDSFRQTNTRFAVPGAGRVPFKFAIGHG